MFEDENLYCKMFIDFGGELSQADQLIAKLTNGSIKFKWGLIETAFAELDVRRNDDFKTPKERRSQDPEDAFLFWKYYIDVEPTEGTARTNYVSMVGRLLLDLWAKGINAVAACSFEAELPKR
ncbi:MAG: 1,4-dihydroxy-6-naphthoate synthase [Bacillota bacterium]